MCQNNTDTAFLFPGQGEQYPGMGKDFYDSFPIAKETFKEAEDILSFKISDIIFYGTMQNLTKTIYCQPAVYILSVAILRVIKEQFPDLPADVCSGLSLGEYSALHASGYVSFADGLRLIQKRAQFIHEACEKTQGTMAAVLGLNSQVIEKTIRQLQKNNCQLWIANYNSPGQTVISGSTQDLPKAIVALKENGAKRIIPLSVAGAFHSGLMKSVEEQLKDAIEQINFLKTSSAFVMNFSGDFVTEIDNIKHNLIKQVSGSVLWEKGIRAIDKKKCRFYLEIGCGKVLSALNKKIGVQGESFSIGKVEDLKLLQQKLEALKTLAQG